MSGLSVRLPLRQDEVDGLYQMNKTLVELVKQDFRMLMLTEPGERILLPEYGVGLLQWLFEPAEMVESIQGNIVDRINEHRS